MKMMIGAIALLFAAPAIAQAAPAGDQASHHGKDHGQHSDAKHDCKECCEKMKNGDGKMECMDKKAGAKSDASGHGHQDHEGHDH